MNKNSFLISLSESEKTKVGKEDFARQSLPQKVFSAIWAVESEVNNGSSSQYFFNSSGESASFVVEALELSQPVLGMNGDAERMRTTTFRPRSQIFVRLQE